MNVMCVDVVSRPMIPSTRGRGTTPVSMVPSCQADTGITLCELQGLKKVITRRAQEERVQQKVTPGYCVRLQMEP